LAALALYDGGAEISSDNISALLSASNNKVAPYWPALFAGFLKGRVDTLVYTIGGSGPAASAGAAAPAAEVAASDAPKKEEKKEEVVDALDGGMDLFGGPAAAGGDY
jgi:large subunit ribosomal protein LP1